MKCPVCSNELVQYQAGTLSLDICRDGCSGIWLDKGELAKCDEQTEQFPEELLRVRKNAAVVIDRTKPRSCPKCSDSTLTRNLLDAERRFEIDTCPKCEGHWLDIGELDILRKTNQADAELDARLKSYEQKIAEKLKSTDSKHRVQALIRVVFG